MRRQEREAIEGAACGVLGSLLALAVLAALGLAF